MFTFRTSITFAVMTFIVALAVLLITIQVRALRWATQEAASAYMDATSTKAVGRLQSEIAAMASLVRVLATSSSVADSNERTETGRAIPLGAFYRSVTVDATHEPAIMLASAHQALEREENLVIVVDDAQLLDPLSATLVHQLAVSGQTGLIVVVRTGDSAPDAMTSLWKEQLLLPLSIKPFTRKQVAELVRGVLGGEVDGRLIDELHQRTAGNLLLLRGLLSAGREKRDVGRPCGRRRHRRNDAKTERQDGARTRAACPVAPKSGQPHPHGFLP